ncbi:MAG: phage integrase N-terminal SAM-like domain-containing protein [Opitutales bacterium]|nr:phage integrase N-terminal SAM-like domain-containing protein [Opitutales bacterium]
MSSPNKVKITKFKNRSGNSSWRVSGTINGERIRKNFESHAEALNEKQHYNTILALDTPHRTAVTVLSDVQISEAQDAFNRLGERHSLSFAVDYFLKHYREPVCDYAVKDVVHDFLHDKRAAGVRERSITQLKSTLKRFATYAERMKLHDIQLEHLQGFMSKHEWSRKTQNNVRADLHSFFEWTKAKPREWIHDNPAHDLPKFKIERGVPDILSVQQCAKLMEHVQIVHDGAFIPYFALALFAGIRPQFPSGELGKLAMLGSNIWQHIDLRNHVIRIAPDISKTGEYRTVDIQPNLKAWLKSFARRKAPIYGTNFEKDYKAIRQQFQIGHDVLRHSYISYHVAQFQTVGGTALQAGNTEAIIRKHYLKMVSKTEASKFWSISPL